MNFVADCVQNPFDQDSLCDKLFVYDPKVAELIRELPARVDKAEE